MEGRYISRLLPDRRRNYAEGILFAINFYVQRTRVNPGTAVPPGMVQNAHPWLDPEARHSDPERSSNA